MMQHLLRTAAVQPKLSVNAPGDEFEREADRVADQVMRMPDPGAGGAPAIQRTCAHCRKELKQERIQRVCSECEHELQRKPRDSRSAPEIDASLEAEIGSLRGGGAPLPESVRDFFEPRFGHDFSEVRVHAAGRAAETARNVDALAYTTRNHIVFAPGRYAPESAAGRRLLAHELAHTIQQGEGRPAPGDAIQRRGDLTKLPAGLPCPPATDNPLAVIDEFFFSHGQTDLNATQKATIEAFVVSWRAAGGTTDVRVDGYASPAGTDETNWVISCKRAKAVEAELLSPSSGSVPGIPSGQVKTLAQGETAEFSNASGPDRDGPNRKATISALTPQPQACPTITCPFAPTQPPLPSPPAAVPVEPQRIDPGIPSGARCRGACGPDCPTSCTPLPDIHLCVTDPASGCHAECTYTGVISCATHEGCRTHDDCYDACAAAGEAGLCGCPVRACLNGTTTCTNPCHCACDRDCCNTHNSLDCGKWSQGATTPRDALFNYAAAATAGPSSPGACPP